MGRPLALTFSLLTLFSWNDRFPGKAPFPKASHSSDDNSRRKNTKIKQGSNLVAIFLWEILSADLHQQFWFLKENALRPDS